MAGGLFPEPEEIDLSKSTRWAIATVDSAGILGAGQTLCDLANPNTGRAHRLRVTTAGIGIGLPVSASFTASDYVYFDTPRPVNFEDFNGRGAQINSLSAAVYSETELIVFDGALFGKVLAKASWTGWGLSLPGIEKGHGITQVDYGDGRPLVGPVATSIVPGPDPFELDIRTIKVTQTAQEDPYFMVKLDGDALFDFDKDTLKPEAERVLKQAGGIIRSSRTRYVEIEGYTDSKGDAGYNRRLSQRRADATARWLIVHNYIKAESVQPKGSGSTNPVAPNTRPDGQDDPAGRAKNRRVEIRILKTN